MKKTSRSVDSIAWLTRFFTGALVLASFLSTLTLLADGPITVNTSAAQIRADGSIGGIPNLLRPSDNISHRFYVSDTDITEGEEITVISEWYGLENMGSVGGVGVSKFQPDFNFNAFPPPATSAPGYPILTAHGIQGANQAWVTSGGNLQYPPAGIMGSDVARGGRIEIKMRPPAGSHTLTPGGWFHRRWNYTDFSGVMQMQTAATMFWLNNSATTIQVRTPNTNDTTHRAEMSLCSGTAQFVVTANRTVWSGCVGVPELLITLYPADGSGNITGGAYATFRLTTSNTVSVSRGTLSRTDVQVQDFGSHVAAIYPSNSSSALAIWSVPITNAGNYVAVWTDRVLSVAEGGAFCTGSQGTGGSALGTIVAGNNCGNLTLTVQASPPNGGTASASKTSNLSQGEVVTLTAATNPGFIFNGWTADANDGGSFTNPDSLNATYRMGIGSRSIIANFPQFTYALAANAFNITGTSWAPTLLPGGAAHAAFYAINGNGAFMYRVIEGTNYVTPWQPLSTPWTPTTPGNYRYYMGQMGDGTYHNGNTNEPGVGNININPTSYTLDVYQANVSAQVFDNNTDSVDIYVIPGYLPVQPLATNIRIEVSNDGGNSWTSTRGEVDAYGVTIFNPPYTITTPGTYDWLFRSVVSPDNGVNWSYSTPVAVNFTVTGGGIQSAAIQGVTNPNTGYEQWYAPSLPSELFDIQVDR